MINRKSVTNLGEKVEGFIMSNILLSFLMSLIMVTGPMSCVSLATKISRHKLAVPSANKKIANKIEDYKKRLEILLAPVKYHYVAAGKPDPFMPFLRTETSKRASVKSGAGARRLERCDTPLECMDVGQLTLVGIVLEPHGRAIAMAQDASGVGYTLRLGTKIGYNKGQVVSIDRDKVIVREMVKDLKGRSTFKNRILYLHPEENDESS